MRWVRAILVSGLVLGLAGVPAGCAVESRGKSCTSDANCPEGQGCVDRVCGPVDCRASFECDEGQVCRDHTCVEVDGCGSDQDCDAGRVCDVDAGLCVDCLLDDDCELGQVCAEGECLAGCTGDRDCPAGLTCFEAEPPHGVCAECLADGDCVAGERCVDNVCEAPCSGDGECPAGEICEGGSCRPGCRADADCPDERCDPAGLVCVECLIVDDCELGNLCVDKACSPGCKTDRDCPAGEICLDEQPPNGQCVVCDNPDDCPEQFVPRACIEPLSLDFGSVPPGDATTLSFTISSCGLADLTLGDVSLGPDSSDDFTLVGVPAMPTVLAAGEEFEVQVRYSPAVDGEDSGGVDIYSDDPTSEPATDLTGTVALLGRSESDYCDLDVSPAALDFGVIRVGQTGQLGLSLTNLGNSDCVLDQVSVVLNTPNGEYALATPVAAGTVIVPGDWLDVEIAYGPVDPGHDVGRLDILSNDKDGAELSVDLAGFGQADGDGPVAVCSVDPIVGAGLDTLTWMGDQSFDSGAGRTISQWTWEMISAPTGSSAGMIATADAANRATPTDVCGSYAARLVVANDLGQTSQPCTATAQVVPTQDLWVEMYWQQPGDDMDLHLIAPGGTRRTNTDCYYANCVGPFDLDWGSDGDSANNPRLALDDINGSGPEIIHLQSPDAGVYTVFVHDYPGSNYIDANQVTVNVWIRGVMVETFERAISGEDLDWDVCQIHWPSGTVTAL